MAGRVVAAEDGDGGGVLIAADEPSFCGVEGEVARGFATAGDALNEGERAVRGCDAKTTIVSSPRLLAYRKLPSSERTTSAAVLLATGKLGAMVLTGAPALTRRP